jgi:arylsulfatase A-like enzyme
MPTVLSLCGVPIPATIEGRDRSHGLERTDTDDDDAALLACYAPFGEWTRAQGGREYRGVRTKRYTYIRDLNGPWLLYDNKKDPYQRENLVNAPRREPLRRHLEILLARKLDEAGDRFLPANAYIAKWGYKTDASGTVSYTP